MKSLNSLIILEDAKNIGKMLELRMQGSIHLTLYLNLSKECAQMCLEIVSLFCEFCCKISFEVLCPSCLPEYEQIAKDTPLIVFSTIEDSIKSYSRIIRFGAPLGYDLSGFISTIIEVSLGKPELCELSVSFLKQLNKKIILKILVGSVCPFCPLATHFGNQFALANENITVIQFNVQQYPAIGKQYNIKTLPTILINDQQRIMGLPTEICILDKIKMIE